MNCDIESYKEKAVQSIISGNKRIKVISTGPFWEYKSDYNGRKALIRCNGGVNIAIAGMRPPQRECDEFYAALEIINEVERLKNE